MNLEFKRAFAPEAAPCAICHDMMNRLLAFKKPEEKEFAAFFLCDDCFDGMKTCPVAPRIEG